MASIRTNALALKYKGEYGTARRYIDISDVANYPLTGRVGRVFGPGFFEQLESLGICESRSLDEHGANPALIGKNAIK